MQYDHVILGGGMSGCLIALLLAAHRKGETIAIIEPGQLGGGFARGGFQYLRNSEGVRAVLDAHRVDYDVQPMLGGVLTHKGRVLAYPEGLGDHVTEAQRLHYRKTRGTLDGFVPGVMNFGGTGGERVLCDLSRVIKKVSQAADIIQAGATVVSGPMACVGPRQWVEALTGRIISTVPLPVLANLLQLDLAERPKLAHETLCVARIPINKANGPLGHYAYTYTPWLEAIHRVRPVVADNQAWLELEWNATLDKEDDAPGGSVLPNAPLNRDMAKLGGLMDSLEVRTLPGHLHPVEWGTWRPNDNIRLAGRFAQWEPRMTVDQVADDWHKELADDDPR